MERGEEETTLGRHNAFPITNFADVKARRFPTIDRRKFPSGRRAAIPSLSPFARKRGMSPLVACARAAGLLSSSQLANRPDQPAHLDWLGEMFLKPLVESLLGILAPRERSQRHRG